MKKLLTTLGVLALASTLGLAEDNTVNPVPTAPAPATPAPVAKKHHRKPGKAFAKLDTNNDGFLSLEEFKAGPKGQKNPTKAEKAYRKMDLKGDGKVTLDEFTAYQESHVGKGKKAAQDAASNPSQPTPAPAKPPGQ